MFSANQALGWSGEWPLQTGLARDSKGEGVTCKRCSQRRTGGATWMGWACSTGVPELSPGTLRHLQVGRRGGGG